MRYVKAYYHFAYVHPENRIEVVDPGSVVMIADDDIARQFVARGLGEYHPGPVHLARGGVDESRVERPGLDPRPGRSDRAIAPAQRA